MIPASPTGPVSSAPEQKLPGKVGIVIGILTIIAGIVVGIALVVFGAISVFDGFDDLQRVPLSTGGTVEIDEPGSQAVYAERPSSAGGGSFSSGGMGVFVPDIQVSVEGPDGSAVVVSPRSGSETYEWDGRQGVQIAQFSAPEAGTYRVRGIAGDGAGTFDTIAVGQAINLGGIASLFGGIFGGGLLVVLGLIILIVSLVRRSSAKKRRNQASNPWGGQPPGGGWAAPPATYGAPGQFAGGYGQPSSTPGWVPPPMPPAQPPTPSPPPGSYQPPAAPPPKGDAPGWGAPPPPWPGAPSTPPAESPPWQPPGQDSPR